METKIQAKYIYEGLGFPVELTHVEMVKIGKAWAPKIDVRKLAKDVLNEIPTQETRLTGAQIRFVRETFGMSLRDFAKKVVHQSHMAVSKWEKFGDEPTNMDVATEVVLRLYVFHEATTKKPKQEKRFFQAYETISSMVFKNSKLVALSL
jgi:DNA-binding transcriptional regulator YiaG